MTRQLASALALSLLAVGGAQAGLNMFDNGTGAVQVVTDNGYTYILKENNTVWRHDGVDFAEIDNGSGPPTRMLAADQGRLFLLKQSGNIYEFDQRNWNLVDDGQGTKQITAGAGRLYVLKDSGNIWRRRNGQWDKIDDGLGTKRIYAHQHVMWVLKDNNHTWRYDDSEHPSRAFRQISRGNVSLTQDIVGDTRFCYILKGDGKVWRWQPNGSQNGKFDMLGQGSKHWRLAMDEGSLNVLTRRGNVWRWDRRFGGWNKIPVSPGTKAVTAENGRLFLVTREGSVLRWSQGPFAPQGTALFNQLHGD